jgi:hypothetical protein
LVETRKILIGTINPRKGKGNSSLQRKRLRSEDGCKIDI